MEISVGKERYKLFKTRYYITEGNITTYYYGEYFFWDEFFQMCERHELNSLQIMTLGSAI